MRHRHMWECSIWWWIISNVRIIFKKEITFSYAFKVIFIFFIYKHSEKPSVVTSLKKQTHFDYYDLQLTQKRNHQNNLSYHWLVFVLVIRIPADGHHHFVDHFVINTCPSIINSSFQVLRQLIYNIDTEICWNSTNEYFITCMCCCWWFAKLSQNPWVQLETDAN